MWLLEAKGWHACCAPTALGTVLDFVILQVDSWLVSLFGVLVRLACACPADPGYIEMVSSVWLSRELRANTLFHSVSVHRKFATDCPFLGQPEVQTHGRQWCSFIYWERAPLG